MGDISVISKTQIEFNDGILLATVYLQQPSDDLISAIAAYPSPQINVGGSIPSHDLIYSDLFHSFIKDFAVTKTFDMSTLGESTALSAATAWTDYVHSQLISSVETIHSKVVAFDSNQTVTSNLVDPS